MSKSDGNGRKVFADTMTTIEMAEHRRRNGIVLLPIGCCEMHGVHVGVSCDSFLAEAACRVLAEEWDAVILPMIHYTYPGATSRWPGSVSILPRETLDYIIAVTGAILRNGFKRVVLVSLHGPNGPIIEMALRTVFEQTGGIPISFSADYYEVFCQRVEKEWGQPHGEAAVYLASLYICGRHGEFDPTARPGDVGRTFPYESFKKLAEHGVSTPYYFQRPEDHVGACPDMKLEDAPRLAEMYREIIVARAKGLPEDYEAFQNYTWQLMKDAPWDK